MLGKEFGLLLFWLTISTLFACQGLRGLPDEALERTPRDTEEDLSSESASTDPFTLINAEIKEDSIFIEVQYSGGCADHDFRLIEQAPMVRSMPPKRLLQLYHESNDDPCRALIQEVRSIDLKPFRASPHGLTILRIDSLELMYRYD
ncbi:MAG: hypothetical protein ACO2XQ_09045 [Flavobacteriales bacterium]